MNWFPARSHLPRPRARERWFRPHLEGLEQRNCPSAPQISFTLTQVIGQTAQLQGSVADEHPGGIGVTFGGAAGGTTVTSPSGTFTHSVPVASLGLVTAVCTDDEGLSASAEGLLTNIRPSVSLSVSYVEERIIRLSGQVNDDAPGGLTVNFTGVATGQATTDESGGFSLTVEASQLGQVTANVSDIWSQAADPSNVTLSSMRPDILEFWASEVGLHFFRFQGRVADESPEGLVVRLSGLPSIEGRTAIVQADGTFTVSIMLQPNEEGMAAALVTDWWGLTSDEALTTVNQTG